MVINASFIAYSEWFREEEEEETNQTENKETKTDTFLCSREIYILFSFPGVIECSYKLYLTSTFSVQERTKILETYVATNQLFVSRGNFVANSQGGKYDIATPSKA